MRVNRGTNSLRLQHLNLCSKWNIVKNGVKHHNSHPIYMYKMYISSPAIYIYILFSSVFIFTKKWANKIKRSLVTFVSTTKNSRKYKIAQSTSFMLCMSYSYINKSSSLFLSHPLIFCYFGVMVFTATFNNIAIISWRSVLLVEETGVPGGNHQPVASHWQTLSHTVVSSTSRHERGSKSQLTLC
jgi:hypothetical protein